MTLVQVEHLVFDSGRRRVLDGVSFGVEPGRSLAVVGPNGCGKSALLRLLATAERPSAGRIMVDGYETTRSPREVRRRIGYVPDQYGRYPNLTVAQYLDFFARAAGVSAWERQDAVDSMLRVVDLYEIRNLLIQDLSLGLTRRLALARALVHNPTVLVLDDPLLGLDGRGRLEIREVLRELTQMQITSIIATHILADVVDICPDVLVLNDGRVSYVGPISDVLATATSPRQRVCLRIREGMDIAREVLGESVTVRDLVERGPELAFTLIGDDDALADLLARLVERGARVSRFGQGVEALDEQSAGVAEMSPREVS